MGVRGLWMALAACLILLTTASSASAMVCVVRVGRAPVDEALFTRVLGQTSDLPLAIVREPGSIEPEVAAAQATADALGRSHGARAVVWFTVAPSGDVTVFIVDLESRRRFVHRVSHDTGSRSAILETASLIVRDVLKSLLEGEPIGPRFESRPSDVDEMLRPLLLASSDVPRALPITIVHEASRSAVTPFTGFGARAVLSNTTPSHGLAHRVGVLVHQQLRLGLAATLGFEDERKSRFASLLLRRHTMGAFGGWQWKLGDDLAASIDVHAGMALFFRSTRAITSDVEPSASRVTVNAYTGPEVSIRWAPRRSWLHVVIGAGADVVFAPPTFSFEDRLGRTVSELELWAVQPHLTASLELSHLP